MIDATLRSWVESANDPAGDFPIQNLPFGVFRGVERPTIGVAIGNRILDLRACSHLLPSAAECQAESCNALMSIGAGSVRQRLADLLSRREHKPAVERCLVPMNEVEMLRPATIGDYTDFYASIDHATNAGKLFRPDNPLLPNYKYIPIGYHGRASSIVVSGTDVTRPHGQSKSATQPVFGPAAMLDYELEAGIFIGPGNALGEPILIAQAGRHIFGYCLVNDWSARDIQAWEYQPLGPFLGKSFATSISPWIVTSDALEPYRIPALPRPPGDPEPLAYLAEAHDRSAIDLRLEVYIATRAMPTPHRLSRANLRRLYWTPAQLVAHHTSNGCNLRPGDLLATGTVSGPNPGEQGCLLEITQRGANTITLPSGETRTFLEDGDEIILRGWCEREGYARVGFGECRGRVVAR